MDNEYEDHGAPPRHTRAASRRAGKRRRRLVFVGTAAAALGLTTLAALFGLGVLP